MKLASFRGLWRGLALCGAVACAVGCAYLDRIADRLPKLDLKFRDRLMDADVRVPGVTNSQNELTK